MNTQDKLAEALPSFRDLEAKLGTPDGTFEAWRNATDDKRWKHFDLSALRIGYELGKSVQSHATEAAQSADRDAKDAARYRWWRENGYLALANGDCLDGGDMLFAGTEMDEYTDAAMAKESGR